MGFKDKLKTVMDEHNWSQIYVAGTVGRSVSTVSMWLAGKTEPSETRCKDIALALGLPVDYFRDTPNTGFRRLTVEQTARVLGTSKDTVRLGLQQGVFPWGYAIQTDGGWTYIINGGRLEQVEGVKVEGGD